MFIVKSEIRPFSSAEILKLAFSNCKVRDNLTLLFTCNDCVLFRINSIHKTMRSSDNPIRSHNRSTTPMRGKVPSVVHRHLPRPSPWLSVWAPYNSGTDRSCATLYTAYSMEDDHSGVISNATDILSTRRLIGALNPGLAADWLKHKHVTCSLAKHAVFSSFLF